MISSRSQLLNSALFCDGPVLYWMSRDQRAVDNWALLEAQNIARKQNRYVIVAFCLRSDLRNHAGTARMLDFMLAGLSETEKVLRAHNIPFVFLIGDPTKEIPTFCHRQKIGVLVTDFQPLRINNSWKQSLIQNLSIPIIETDAHNVVPCFVASPKREYGAYTIRPKIHKLLNTFLTDFPKLDIQMCDQLREFHPVDWHEVRNNISVREDIKLPTITTPGTAAGHNLLQSFIQNKLHVYEITRNDPNIDGTSNLSGYLHFGQISAQQVAWEVQNSSVAESAKVVFLEELIVRRELADNFCLHTPNYDTIDAFPAWSQETLRKHLSDPRSYVYSYEQFAHTQTHDELWNAAQTQMMCEGKMHGYMRMYWAKKILEWTNSPQEALEIATKLNDLYQLDGRDPNGYAGIAWSMGGVHDRPWFERPIYGSVRYMNANGAAKKFDVKKYIASQQSQK